MNVTTEKLFTDARTQNGFTAEGVLPAKLQELYHLMKWGPTSANCSPARIIFFSECSVRYVMGALKLMAETGVQTLEVKKQVHDDFNAKVDAAFWAGTTVETNFIVSLGEGDPSKLFPRSPRFAFEQIAKFV